MQNRAAKLKTVDSSAVRGEQQIELPLRRDSGYIVALGQQRAVGKSDQPPSDGRPCRKCFWPCLIARWARAGARALARVAVP